MENLSKVKDIEEFLLSVIETEEYKSIEYLVFSIRKPYLDFISLLRTTKFEIPEYLRPLVDVVMIQLENFEINMNEMLQYMLENDIGNWIRYYVCVFIKPALKGEKVEIANDLDRLYALVLTSYILDLFKSNEIDIRIIRKEEKLSHKTNQYGLSVVNGIQFKRDSFLFENKAYLYDILTNTDTIKFGDDMPGFAKVISDKVSDGDILMRLDDRLALPGTQIISYSTLDFERYRGPQFCFNETRLKEAKTITIHIDEETADKLLLVVKKKYDDNINAPFWHIELETLPCIDNVSKRRRCITIFLHGIFYPKDNCFRHIDCACNQYTMSNYEKKYSECSEEIPVDLHTESKELHYKIWCIENGRYTKEIWYELMLVSLPKRYQTLLNEILGY